MGCCPPSSTFGFEHIFSRIRCVLACCGVEWSYKIPSSVMEKTLTSIYLDPSQPASFRGLDAVYRAVKEKGKNKISRKQVREWLSQQDVYTLHKPRAKTLQEKPSHRSWNRCPVSSGFGRFSKSQSLSTRVINTY